MAFGWQTIRKFLHRSDGYLYTSLGESIPIRATTNANLTGPITSVGNATAIASQTGTGTTFVMSVSPTITGDVTINDLSMYDLEGMIYYSGGQ